MNDMCDLCPERVSTVLADGCRLCHEHYDQAWAFQKAVEAEATIAAGGPFPQVCPRRGETPPLSSWPDSDTWSYGHGLVGGGTQILTCSFCGGALPAQVIAKVAAGWTLSPTNKRYKAYLHDPGGAMVAKVYGQHFQPVEHLILRQVAQDGVR